MWYLGADGQTRGPVTEEALGELIAAGTITPDTFMWREGLAEWMPLRQLQPANPALLEDAGIATCSICGQRVGSQNLIELLGRRVCATCKPKAVQSLQEGVPVAANGGEAWRSGNKIVTYKDKELPPRCIKCNAPVAGPPLTRKVYWHSPLFYLLILVHFLVYAVVAILVRKRAKVDIYLCPQHEKKRKDRIMAGWVGVILGIVGIAAGIIFHTALLGFLGGMLFLLAAIFGLVSGRAVAASRIKGDTVWLRGGKPEFLASLPEWP
jgi:hypothetical protein